tara:strand:- start:374 stop:658 length:285 start_codon:yes stop_codon:yes gene_type:complete
MLKNDKGEKTTPNEFAKDKIWDALAELSFRTEFIIDELTKSYNYETDKRELICTEKEYKEVLRLYYKHTARLYKCMGFTNSSIYKECVNWSKKK